MCVSVSPSLPVPIPVSLCPSLSLFSLSLSLSLSSSICVCLSLSVSPCPYPCLSLSFRCSLSLSLSSSELQVHLILGHFKFQWGSLVKIAFMFVVLSVVENWDFKNVICSIFHTHLIFLSFIGSRNQTSEFRNKPGLAIMALKVRHQP